ncbi:hypothetical protein Pint_27592 [Pistacia integerrima]|uniref:Uncharacterized protein n=1 Tax=Pistacia integerrima TaxID=434235 RepID=A0ACC0YR84_9ROSI|nr:hypothetical protein Pint_27592 [Pistacia integerrima]
MANHFSFIFFLISFFAPWCCIFAINPACRTTCGSIDVKYPFGTGYGCGSPRFYPYVTCPKDHLLLNTHTGSYPITSISYTTSALTITPPSMSTCSSMQQSPNIGLDWASPFELGPSTFLLLSCTPPTSSLTVKGSPVCDTSSSHLCDSFYTCPSVIGLSLPLFPPSNTCCVYSPANFNSKGELDLRVLKCGGYTSIVSLEDFPTDPNQWQYGVSLKYTHGAFDNYYIDNKCNACEESGGVCGFSPPSDAFICVCKNGTNSTIQCSYFNIDYQGDEDMFGSSASSSTWTSWLGILGGMMLLYM